MAAPLRVTDSTTQELVFEGTTKDERFDANDHLEAQLLSNRLYRVEARIQDRRMEATVRPGGDERKVMLCISDATPALPTASAADKKSPTLTR